MGGFGIAGSLNLSMCFLSESNAEHSQNVSVGSLCLDKGLNKGMPLFDHGASLVSGDVHTVEVGVAVKSLDLIDLELKLSPVLGIGRVVAVSKGGGENTTSQTVSRVDETGSLVDWCHANLSLVKSRGKDVVPFFLSEWVATK